MRFNVQNRMKNRFSLFFSLSLYYFFYLENYSPRGPLKKKKLSIISKIKEYYDKKKF